MAQLLRVDFHCHTHFSKDSLSSLADLRAACRRRGIDRLVLTDHNSIQAGAEANALDPELFILGEEVKTTRGELLAAYVTREVPAGLDPLEAIERLRGQGAFISVSHPFDAGRSGGWKLDDLEGIVPLVDAIEVFNARCLSAQPNHAAARFAAEHGLAGAAGSDAHAAFEVGQASLCLPSFSNAEELKAAVRLGKPEGRLSPWWVHAVSSYARWKKIQISRKS